MSERAISDGAIFRIRAAQRDLIEACGGIARSAAISRYAVPHVGRWNNPNDPDLTLMPIIAVVALEGDCGRPLVTAIMADLNGRDLTDAVGGSEPAGNLDVQYADVLVAVGAATSEYATAKQDGRLTPAEMETVDRAMADVIRQTEEMRATLATKRAGVRLVREG